MRRTVEIEQNLCDFCGKEAAYSKCIGCGIDICYECRKTKAKEYGHSIHFSGSGDGLYCLKCDRKLSSSGDKLHSTYQAIERLRNEQAGYWADFDKRAKEAEAALKKIQGS